MWMLHLLTCSCLRLTDTFLTYPHNLSLLLKYHEWLLSVGWALLEENKQSLFMPEITTFTRLRCEICVYYPISNKQLVCQLLSSFCLERQLSHCFVNKTNSTKLLVNRSDMLFDNKNVTFPTENAFCLQFFAIVICIQISGIFNYPNNFQTSIPKCPCNQ